MARALAALAALLFCSGAARAQDIDSFSKFRVTHPPSLVGAYRHSEALFGRPEFGGSLFGVLVYATPQENRTGCHPFSADPSWPENVVVMMDRGDCTFETKVRNAENAGAVAAVVADTHDVCELGTCSNVKCDCGAPSPGCECRMPLMADDGSSNVHIPSFLIPKYFADQFKSCLAGTAPALQCSTPTPITVSLSWDLPASDGRVDLDLWTTSDDRNSAAFRASISHLIVPLGDKVRFHPHFFIYNGKFWGCTQSVGTPPHYLCDNQCVTQGKYCSPDPDPDHDLKHGHSGSDVVKENLRQMCIWQQANETYATDYGWRWWDYASRFDSNCIGQAADWNECSREQQLEAGIDADRTQKCFDEAGDLTDSGGDNKVLRAELELRSDLSIVVLPTVVVNGIIARGDTAPTTVLKTVCAGFVAGSEPKVCACTEADPDAIRNCLAQASGSGSGSGSTPGSGSHGGGGGSGSKHGQESSSSTDGPSTPEEGLPGWAVFLMVLLTLMVIGLAVAGVMFYRRMQEQMKDISGYMALAAGDDDKGTGRKGRAGFRALDEDAPAQEITAEGGATGDVAIGPSDGGVELGDVVASADGADGAEGKDEPHL